MTNLHLSSIGELAEPSPTGPCPTTAALVVAALQRAGLVLALVRPLDDRHLDGVLAEAVGCVDTAIRTLEHRALADRVAGGPAGSPAAPGRVGSTSPGGADGEPVLEVVGALLREAWALLVREGLPEASEVAWAAGAVHRVERAAEPGAIR